MRKNSAGPKNEENLIEGRLKELLVLERLTRICALLMLISMAGTVLWTLIAGKGGTTATLVPMTAFLFEMRNGYRLDRIIARIDRREKP